MLIIWEVQIKTSMRCHLTLVGWLSLKKSSNNKSCKRVWKKGNPPTLLVGMKISAVTLENSRAVPQKTKNRVSAWSRNPTSSHTSRQSYSSKRFMQYSKECVHTSSRSDKKPYSHTWDMKCFYILSTIFRFLVHTPCNPIVS